MCSHNFAPPCVGEALSLPKLMQLNVSMNIERLRRSGRLRAAPTGAVKTGGWRVARLATPTGYGEPRVLSHQRGAKRD